MKMPLLPLFNHITIAKIICLALLISPLWGLWWFNTDPDGVGFGRNPFLLNWIRYLLKSSAPAAIAYTGVFLLAVFGFVIVTFIRPRAIRVPLMLCMLVGWAIELSILDLNGAPSSQNLFWFMWKERAIAPEVVGGYIPYIVRDCAVVAILGVALCAQPARRFSVSGVFALVPLVSGVLVASMITYTKGAAQFFPIPFGTFSNAAIVLVGSTINPNSVPRSWDPALLSDVLTNDDAKIEGTVHPVFNKVVMIMDESVRGDYVSLNDEARNTTPFLKATHHVINFGVASSGGNCSHLSRTMIRLGMLQSDLPNKWHLGLKRPTIWQYARRAGYKTVYIDAWGGGELSPAEAGLIDLSISIPEDPNYFRDQRLAGKLLHALKDERPAFIYVNKYGAHFPYSTKYPPNFHVAPTPTESDISNSGFDVGTLLSSFLPPFDYQIAQYPKAIAWTVDEFFRTLLRGVNLSETLIVYTSDHGQSLIPGHLTHCSSAPPTPMGEVYVPLFALTSVPEFEQRLRKGAARGFGRFSHFAVFPTLLLAMGYDAAWVNRTYGASLADPPRSDRMFMIGNPGFQPIMISVNPPSIRPREARVPTANVD
jgi:glucan phosphoethanolaminetransferase (alkaline phosphatase superfamily)